jgi:SAM-dependent methyltransferase
MRRTRNVTHPPTTVTQLFSRRVDSYTRFTRAMCYSGGLRSVFMKSSVLGPGLRILDAGCGTGQTTFALRSALDARGIPARAIDAFDLTPAVLDRFRAKLTTSEIDTVGLAEADVLQLDTLPPAWRDYDLVVTAAMLEYVPRSSLTTALQALRERLRPHGTLLLFISRNNVLTKPLIKRWWSANLYTREELRDAIDNAGFTDVSFNHFPLPYRHLDLWGHVVSAQA